MKCFERQVMAHINTISPETLDPLQFAYRSNRSTEDAISIALHTAHSHLDKHLCENAINLLQRSDHHHAPIHINGAVEEQVESFKPPTARHYLG
jgi:hypothetical protein